MKLRTRKAEKLNMKKLLSTIIIPLISFSLVTPVMSKVVSCEVPNDELINKQIKNALKDTLNFNDDWIIDYDNKDKEALKDMLFWSETNGNYVIKNLDNLIRETLLKSVPDLYERYPYFSFFMTGCYEDNDENYNVLINNKGTLNFRINYNLHQLNNFSRDKKSDWGNYWDPKEGRLWPMSNSSSHWGLTKFYKGIERTFESEFFIDDIKINYHQKNYIQDQKKKVDLIAKYSNDSPSVWAFNGKYGCYACQASNYIEFPNRDRHQSTEDFINDLKNNFEKYKEESKKCWIHWNLGDSCWTKYLGLSIKDIEFEKFNLEHVYSYNELKNNQDLGLVYGVQPNWSSYVAQAVIDTKYRLVLEDGTTSNWIEEKLY